MKPNTYRQNTGPKNYIEHKDQGTHFEKTKLLTPKIILNPNNEKKKNTNNERFNFGKNVQNKLTVSPQRNLNHNTHTSL